jgi:hypothetical protein
VSAVVGLVGCTDVTRHDAVVSVRAGFVSGEISRAWPQDGAWRIEDRPRGLFSHLFSARRA